MRIVTLTRTKTGSDGTFGYLETDSGLQMRSGELPWKNNQRFVSCIPAGSYDCVWAFSQKHGWVYHVIRVPGRTDVEIHPANFCGDIAKGRRSELQGCIALGLNVAPMNGQTALLSSREAFKRFYADLQQAPFLLSVEANY
jgi:hypothetical protein